MAYLQEGDGSQKSARRTRSYYVYRLRCPDTGRIRYVGITYDPKARSRSHKAVKSNGRYDPYGKDRWISELKDKGLSPAMEVISPPLSHSVARAWEIRLQFLMHTMYPGQICSPPVRLRRIRTEAYVLSANFGKAAKNFSD